MREKKPEMTASTNGRRSQRSKTHAEREASYSDSSEKTSSERSDVVDESLSSIRHEFAYYEPAPHTATLLRALAHELPHIPADSWTERVAIGGAYLNGERVLGDTSLPLPCRIEYFEPKFPLKVWPLSFRR